MFYSLIISLTYLDDSDVIDYLLIPIYREINNKFYWLNLQSILYNHKYFVH